MTENSIFDTCGKILKGTMDLAQNRGSASPAGMAEESSIVANMIPMSHFSTIVGVQIR
jgi:hypothetical protein